MKVSILHEQKRKDEEYCDEDLKIAKERKNGTQRIGRYVEKKSYSRKSFRRGYS